MAEHEVVRVPWVEGPRENIAIAPPGVNTFGLGVEHITYIRGDEKKEYWKYSLPDVAQVVAVTPEGKVISIREPRPKVGADYPHVIGETVEEKEPPMLAAVRGLIEETGYCPRPLVGKSDLIEAVMARQSQVGDRDTLAEVCESLGGREPLLSSVLHDTGRSERQIYHFLLQDCVKVREGENEVKVRLVDMRELKAQLVDYMLTKPTEAHAGVNSLVTLTLAEAALGKI